MNVQSGSLGTRRRLLRGAALLTLGRSAGVEAAQRRAIYAYVGSFTTEIRRARGDGIHVYRVDGETGSWTHIQHVGGLVNPSFLVLSRDQRFLYSVHADESYATAFRIDEDTGQIGALNQAKTGGVNGVHQAIDPSGRFMLVANYASGTIAALPIRGNGALADFSQLLRLEGPPGPHRIEQTSSHPHQVVFDPSGRFVIVPDKGLDRVFVLRFDQTTGLLSLNEPASAVARSGSAPRHAAFHPRLPVAWVLNEINSSVTTYRWDAQNGTLRPLQILPTLPPEYTGDNTASGIVTSSDGRFVYCSNRGHDSIAAYSANSQTGLLSHRGWTPSQGRVPRFIGFDSTQRFLCAANEQGDTIVIFRPSAAGKLIPAGQIIRNASPATIAFTGASRG
jgi:6-phosphogluconolactonase (cycloisomerase 2 family)